MQIRTIFLELKNNKYIWHLGLALVVISLSSPGAFALDPMGPPTTGLMEGQFELGIDYSNSTMELELTNGKWTEWFNGALNDSGEAVTFRLNDFKMNKIYANLGYGILENCDVFLRLGVVNAEFGDSIWEAGEEFDSQSNLTFCIGSRATFYEEGDLKLGRMIQFSWANLDGDLKASQWTEADSVNIDLIEIQATIGPTYALTDGFSIYGGPFFHFIYGSIEDKFNEEISGGVLSSEYSWDIDETSNFGGYIGAQMTFDEYTFFNIEYQYTSGADLLGLNLIYRF